MWLLLRLSIVPKATLARTSPRPIYKANHNSYGKDVSDIDTPGPLTTRASTILFKLYDAQVVLRIDDSV